MNFVDREALHQKYGDEEIAVISADFVKENLKGEGFIPYIPFVPADMNPARVFLDQLRSRRSSMPRYMAEYTPEFRQLVVYSMIGTNIAGKNHVYVIKRVNNFGDARLNDKLSIGIGGHMNPDEEYLSAAYRELNEELVGISDVEKFSAPAGIICLNENAVDRDHLGIIFDVSVVPSQSHLIGIRETDRLEGCWYTIEQLIKDIDKFEGWSKLLIQSLFMGE